MSSIRSASSSTRYLTSSRRQVPRCMWSSSRPGVATITSAPPAQRVHLLAVTDPAVEDGGAQIGKAGKIMNGGFHLRGQFARRLQHQTAALLLMVVEQRQNGQGEGRRFAGAGLGAADHVAPLHNERNGADLNGGGFYIAHRLDPLQDRRGKAKGGEWHSSIGAVNSGRVRRCSGHALGWRRDGLWRERFPGNCRFLDCGLCRFIGTDGGLRILQGRHGIGDHGLCCRGRIRGGGGRSSRRRCHCGLRRRRHTAWSAGAGREAGISTADGWAGIPSPTTWVVAFGSGFGGLMTGFLAVSKIPLANSMTWPS